MISGVRSIAGGDKMRMLLNDQRGPALISAVSRKDAVGIELRRALVLGHLKPGDKLTQTQLATDLGVSRPTLREALNQLAGEGLIVQEPYRGLRVADITAQQVRDIAAVRLAMDTLAIDAVLADNSGDRLALVELGWDHFERSAYAGLPPSDLGCLAELSAVESLAGGGGPHHDRVGRGPARALRSRTGLPVARRHHGCHSQWTPGGYPGRSDRAHHR